MGRFVLVLAVLTLYIYVLIDLARAPSGEVRILPKWLWAAVVVLVVILGPVLWLVLGRPKAAYPPAGGDGGGGGSAGRRPGPRGPVAPDDDPEFLKRIDEQSWASRMERLRREREGGGGAAPSGDGTEPGPGSAPSNDESDHSGA